ncbi:major facilitator superfamily domain-containing protein [Penicillium hetheringtonii]|uniref:Major facilitator superfamily domain-containing protein n=1 Tax=Penicillium hetheringtonii TaxID=911720 RepID=A0AAD6E4S8_9EURO|nr:major facilitator superfamily domain-containing protein [Penicillium hetheringtonii]
MTTRSQQQGQLRIGKTSNLLCDKSSESDDAGRHETPCDVQIEAGKDVDRPSEPKDLEIDATKSNKNGFALLMTVMALALSMFLVSLDMTIVATAIPRITDEFGGIDLVGWYGSAFFITLGGFQAAWGKIYKYFPLKISFLISIVLFEIGSLICAFLLGVAPNSLALIIGRAITGVGGAGISSGAFTIIAFSAPPKQRPAYIGILGASYGIAAAVGPLIGGAFTSHATWRWCFYINLPIGGVSGVIILLFYRPPPPSSLLNEDLKEKLLQMDLPGAFLLIGAMVCYCLALQWGGLSRSWNDSTVIGALVGFGVLLTVYVVVQWVQKERAAMVGRLFERNVILAMIYIDLLAGTFFLLVYYLPIYFQVVSGVSAAESGIRNLPLILAQSIATILSGIALSKFQRPQPFLLFGAGVTAIGSGLLYTLDIGSSSGKWIGFQILTGIGIGWCFQVPVVTAQSTAAPSDLPSVTGMVLTVQTLGGSVFVSAGQSALDNVLLKSLPNISGIDPKVVLKMGSTELRQAFSSAQLSEILVAYMKGLKAAFLVAIIASSTATVVSMGVRRTKLAGSLPPTAV